MAGVALLICCRKPKTNRRQRDGVLNYVQVADGLTRYQKKEKLRQCVRFGSGEGKSVLKESNFKRIKPDENGDWIGQIDPAFQSMIPLFGKEGNRIFLQSGPAVNTRRDAWVYDFDKAELEARVWRMMEFFNSQPKEKTDFHEDGKHFGWSGKLVKLLRDGGKLEHHPEKIVTSMYRPFQKAHLYFCKSLVNDPVIQFQFFTHGKENQAICLSRQDQVFACLMTDCIPNLSLVSNHTFTLPRWVYSQDGERQSNINPLAIGAFNRALGLQAEDDFVDADGLFHYVYGFLHKTDWRKKWEVTLRKEAARIELPKSLEEFKRTAKAGKELANLHLNYENCPPLELEIEKADGFDENNPAHFEVEKMRWGGKPGDWDKTTLRYNRYLTIRGIPMECHNYRLGARSALEWIVARYQKKTDKRSQISKNPNKWSGQNGLTAGQYIFHLIPRIANLSLKTGETAEELPSIE